MAGDEDGYAGLAKFLAQQLWPDVRSGAIKLATRAVVPYKKATSKVFSSPAALLDALKKNEISAGEWVTLECKPSTFGPFLRNHFMSLISGHHTQMRLGPPLVSNHPIMGMLGQVTSHLKPVGIYPPVSDDIYQLCLYPGDTTAFGFVGLMPGIDRIVQYMPALCSAKNITFSNMACNVRGVVRQLDPDLLMSIGLPIEKWEELRQSGDVWFLDLTSDYAEVNPLGEAVTTEAWGGLYASGHYEIADGELQIKPLVDGMAESLQAAGVTPHVIQNQAKRREILVYGEGVRAVIDTQHPLFSVHMDAELAIDYARSRGRFDQIVSSYLRVIEETAGLSSAEVTNLHDLDFTYTDSARAHTVLTSQAADNIADPLAMAMRDWHRKRNRS